jgi:predicted nucleotidyltransferase
MRGDCWNAWRSEAEPMLDLSASELACLRSLLVRRLPGREVWAFGSRVNGRAKPHSDLDLVVMAPIMDLERFELSADLDDSDLPFRVDVVVWQELPESMRAAIGRDLAPVV